MFDVTRLLDAAAAGDPRAAADLLLIAGGLSFTEATGGREVRRAVIRLFSPEGTLVVEIVAATL